jgi:hypothetical protein
VKESTHPEPNPNPNPSPSPKSSEAGGYLPRHREPPAPRESNAEAQKPRRTSAVDRTVASRAVELADPHRAVVRGLAGRLEPTRRRRAHVQASALAGEEARGGTVASVASVAVARRKEERLRGTEGNELGLGQRSPGGGFVRPDVRPMRSNGCGWFWRRWAPCGPGGALLCRPRPRLRPGARSAAPRARWPRWAGPHWAVLGSILG